MSQKRRSHVCRHFEWQDPSIRPNKLDTELVSHSHVSTGHIHYILIWIRLILLPHSLPHKHPHPHTPHNTTHTPHTHTTPHTTTGVPNMQGQGQHARLPVVLPHKAHPSRQQQLA